MIVGSQPIPIVRSLVVYQTSALKRGVKLSKLVAHQRGNYYYFSTHKIILKKLFRPCLNALQLIVSC
jgi:hypothetical protein